MSFAFGQELSAAGTTVSITTQTESETRPTWNVIGDLAAKNPKKAGKTVVVGAHLDSVVEGPGINDNGSGSATILEIAEEMSELKKPANPVRFAFWGAEESGLLGSEHYVASLSAAEIAKIGLNLNFDMLGSPNFVRFVYDGDGSADRDGGPRGLRRDRADVQRVLRVAGPGGRADGVRRALGLRAVHRDRHPGGWPVLGCGGHQEHRAGADVRRCGR